jgi:hydroxyethylthiazole kinase
MNILANTLKKKIVETAPLILNLTNIVTPDLIANGLLSLGASPVMTQDANEIEELTRYASAVVINMGTLNDTFKQLARVACGIANDLGKPLILDPVGAGATVLRTDFAVELLSDYAVTVVRGNASEIAALSGAQGDTKGVDSTKESALMVDTAKAVAEQYRCVVVMSGAVDVVASQMISESIARGSPLMPRIVGTGCLLSAVIGAFCAVHSDPFEAALYGSYFYALCGERAALDTSAPGSFRVAMIDALYQYLEG